MILPKIILPDEFRKKSNIITPQIESLPFYVKECGYCSERKFVLGNHNNYSDYLLLYSVSGVMRFTKSQKTQYVHPDHIVVSACNTPLTFTKVSKDWKFFYIIIGGTHAKLYYNSIRTSSCLFATNQLSRLLSLFLEVFTLDLLKNMQNNLKASLLIHTILYELYTISDNILKAKNITPVQETVVNMTLKYIEKNYKNNLDIDTICNEVSFSKYYFCKLFKEHTGFTIHQYINDYRINKSKELLTYSKLSINAIATSVGFKNTLTFSRSFERTMHMTPSEYRKYF